jgi:hypothetical protein
MENQLQIRVIASMKFIDAIQLFTPPRGKVPPPWFPAAAPRALQAPAKGHIYHFPWRPPSGGSHQASAPNLPAAVRAHGAAP